MTDQDWLAQRFESHRTHLRAVAYRMLGSLTEADDAVQDAWIRLRRADTGDVENLRGWLTTVVGRVCLNMLRSRRTRRGPGPGRRLRLSRTGAAASPVRHVTVNLSLRPRQQRTTEDQ
jgi:RNA polymerase sigma factor (sigma-70 family)